MLWGLAQHPQAVPLPTEDESVGKECVHQVPPSASFQTETQLSYPSLCEMQDTLAPKLPDCG